MEKKSKKSSLPFWIISRKKVLSHVFFETISITIIFHLFYDLIEIKANSFNYFLLSFTNIIWITISYLLGRFSRTNKEYKYYKSIRSFLNIVLCLILTSIINFLSYRILDNFFPISINLANYNNFLILNTIACFIIETIINGTFKFKKNNLKKTWLFIGSEERANKLIKFCNNEIINSEIIKIKSRDNLLSLNKRISGLIIENIKDIDKDLEKEINILFDNGTTSLSIIEWCEVFLQRYPPNIINDFEFKTANLFIDTKLFQLRIKRLLDFIFSVLILLITIPLIILCGFIIKIQDGGPIFYSQVRTGLKGKHFKILKLRTMRIDAEKSGFQWATANDKRITYFGRFLRKFRIDELPQLINVIKGELSLIGPRPERPEIDSEIKSKISHYQIRNIIKPGLSGWAQVNYPYGASLKDAENKLSYDLFYIINFNLILDLLIAIKTIKLISNAEGSEPSI